MNPQDSLKEMSSAVPLRPVPATEEPVGSSGAGSASDPRHEIKIGKIVVPRQGRGEGAAVEVFTLTLGTETIRLLPLKNWSQLDVFKWRARGLLPCTPAGLEITSDHLKVSGETVSTLDPQACSKLEKAFNDWLALERQSLELAKAKAQTPKAHITARQPEEDVVRFQVEVDNAGKGRVKCLEGNEMVKVVALNLQGFSALIEQGLMRRPRALKVGALHDWVELDGELFRFQKGTNWAGELETVLNERYVWTPEASAPAGVTVYPNPASSAAFDVQFPATPYGLAESRRCHLNEESVELLRDT